jgi:cellulose synthase/poly-beta-1,6-N-acetylglucosamine synthase-like glycosyltransferase
MSTFILLIIILISLITLANRVAKYFLLVNSYFADKGRTQQKIVPSQNDFPEVAIHVAISNEDPDIVKKTLSSLLELDYPNYIVMVIDNNTKNKKLWIPIKSYCEQNSDILKFYHVETLKGYKAGALDFALRNTAKHIQIIAIVDADNVVTPEFLKNVVVYFSDESLAFVQTPLGFQEDPITLKFQSWIFLIYRYFLSVYMSATNRFRCSPFIGSMGLIRRTYLESVGGWKGFYLTEDMELSYRFFQMDILLCLLISHTVSVCHQTTLIVLENNILGGILVIHRFGEII